MCIGQLEMNEKGKEVGIGAGIGRKKETSVLSEDGPDC